MRRLIVIGANGVGKSYAAARLSEVRPDIPLVSFDAIKLTCNWKQRSGAEIETKLSQLVATDAWILEGGPSLLRQALPRAEGVIWLDPPELVRAWRLLARPWFNFGKTRPELPSGNVDWPIQQYKFAISSIKNGPKCRNEISNQLDLAKHSYVWHCRSQKHVHKAVGEWSRLSG